MAVVRVFLCTYRRPVLLERAVESLRRQTMTDWMCELHNDDPTDVAPAALVERLGDPRIRLVTHSQNYGATKTLNLPFSSSIEEPFVSLLEDDNWWEPGFLERMLGALNRRPDVTVGYATLA
jgi:glycosyltransferase involved in cell wall biosynthesis